MNRFSSLIFADFTILYLCLIGFSLIIGGTGSDQSLTPSHSPNLSGARKKKSKSKKSFGLRYKLGKLGDILKNPFQRKDKSKKITLDDTFMHDSFNIFLKLNQLGKDARDERNPQDEKSDVVSSSFFYVYV